MKLVGRLFMARSVAKSLLLLVAGSRTAERPPAATGLSYHHNQVYSCDRSQSRQALQP